MNQPPSPRKRRKYVPAVGPRLQKLLALVFGLFALLAVNSVYLVAVKLAGWWTGESYENWFYLNTFLVHLLLGALLIIPVLGFGIAHIRNSYNRRNRRAVRVGYGLFAVALLLLLSGVVLTRIEGVIVVNDPAVREVAYWSHVLSPLVAAWLFILHRLAGKRIRWKVGLSWAGVAAVFAAGMLVWQTQDPRAWNRVGNPDGDQYFYPSLARTVSGDFIPPAVLMNDQYCRECHEDVHDGWLGSAHRFGSFNNPAYLASIRETREFVMERDGNVTASRFCAGCHDMVPFFSGAFNDPDYDMENDPTAHAGITCTACHAITHVNSRRGNGDFTIDEPVHYPFAFSENPALKWINRQLVVAKPEFHKKTFLKPLHQTTEFCGVCHKVHLPEELNGYKWLRGQNHQDDFWLSGVSGYGVASFYYPDKAEESCNRCHLPLIESDDFSARVRDESGVTKTMSHLFPSANTALPHLAAQLGRLDPELAQRSIQGHRDFNEGVMRFDLFGVKEGGTVEGELSAPLRPEVPELRPGATYLLEAVLRTAKMGHLFTQGTSDSNQAWVEITATCGGMVVGKSGGMNGDGEVDPWSHFVNSFVLDRSGDRINRRNGQDIFTTLYNHQIPPGAADVIHYRFTVPEDARGHLVVTVALKYRKFDTEYMRFVEGDPDYVNDLPVMVLAADQVSFPLAGSGSSPYNPPSPIPDWERWNDYGIGLLRKGERGELRQAEQAFQRVEALGRPDGPVNLARVYLREGRVTSDAPGALRRARDFDPPARQWSVLWFTGLVNKQNARFDEAIANFKQIVEGGFQQAVGRGFDFSKDWRVLNELGNTLFERAKQERGERRRPRREQLMREAVTWFERTLALDPENVEAHWNLKQIHADLGEREASQRHAELHAKYRPDDNAADRAVASARMEYPAANHAAEGVVIYDLQREGAYQSGGN